VHVPALAVVTGDLRLDRMVDQQRVEPVDHGLLVAGVRGLEHDDELFAEVAQGVEVAAGETAARPVAATLFQESAQSFQTGQPVGAVDQ
jgi:hypothetical protein